MLYIEALAGLVKILKNKEVVQSEDKNIYFITLLYLTMQNMSVEPNSKWQCTNSCHILKCPRLPEKHEILVNVVSKLFHCCSSIQGHPKSNNYKTHLFLCTFIE